MPRLGCFLINIILGIAVVFPSFANNGIAEPDTITLLSFNDFHGYFVKDSSVPGASALVGSLLDEKSRSPHTFIVSGGDNFSGSFFSKITEGEPLSDMFSLLGVEVSAVGNHEFDWGKDFLLGKASQQVSYIAANIEKEDKQRELLLPPYKILSFTLKNGKPFRIVFIGLTTVETKYKTGVENVAGLDFVHPFAAAGIQLAYNLKNEGKTDMVVLLCHLGTDMDIPGLFQEHDSRMLPYMDGIDAIITAHSHKVVLGTINDVPIIQAGSYGKYYGKLQFKISGGENDEDFKVEYIGGDTIKTDRNKRHEEMEGAVNRLKKRHRFDEILSCANDDLLRDSRSYSAMGSLVTSSYADCFRKQMPEDSCSVPIIGVNHAGGIRNDLYKGAINRLEAANILPFAGNIVAYRFTGKMLKKLLNDGRHNPNGMLQTSYLNIYLKGDSVSHVEYILDKKITRIAEDDECIVVLDDYITDGGDQYDSSLFTRPVTFFNDKQMITTDAFIDYLKSARLIHKSDIAIPNVIKE